MQPWRGTLLSTQVALTVSRSDNPRSQVFGHGILVDRAHVLGDPFTYVEQLHFSYHAPHGQEELVSDGTYPFLDPRGVIRLGMPVRYKDTLLAKRHISDGVATNLYWPYREPGIVTYVDAPETLTYGGDVHLTIQVRHPLREGVVLETESGLRFVVSGFGNIPHGDILVSSPIEL